MATKDGPCLDAILDAKGSDRVVSFLRLLEPFFFEERRRWIAPPFPSMLPDAVDSRESSVRGPLTGHFTGRVLRGMFA
jgi:hypothetical protein